MSSTGGIIRPLVDTEATFLASPMWPKASDRDCQDSGQNPDSGQSPMLLSLRPPAFACNAAGASDIGTGIGTGKAHPSLCPNRRFAPASCE
ncbi:hypothetical protein RSSM_00433 [Rhodopirellula sallentina SM41]|uniref:Uncharacterized protein n=1 Tax=Rhodopirellula sallentina SM41 TaxID=1263870 RepID=M5U9X5_9BACT|nr:hypothetical protein RSSM_00433 [Rhodopirellula sallentina SM41]